MYCESHHSTIGGLSMFSSSNRSSICNDDSIQIWTTFAAKNSSTGDFGLRLKAPTAASKPDSVSPTPYKTAAGMDFLYLLQNAINPSLAPCCAYRRHHNGISLERALSHVYACATDDSNPFVILPTLEIIPPTTTQMDVAQAPNP